MAEKETVMVLKVDLQCPKCYKNVKKILCKFPQIRDQEYDVKQNRVTITVICCSPEKIRDKLCCRGGKTIKSIEILKPKEPPKEPPKPKEQPKPKEPEKKEPEKPKQPEKPKSNGKPPKADPPPPKADPAPPKADPAPPKAKPPPKEPEPVQGYPPGYPRVGVCCVPFYEGYPRGPCYHGWGTPPPPPPPPAGPPPCYCGCGGYSYCDGGRFYGSRCEYFSEENASACTIM